MISAPVSAAAGVAARSFQVTSPSKALSPWSRWRPERLGRPPIAVEHHIGARKRQHRKQHQLRLPGQLFLSHASSYPCGCARQEGACNGDR